MIGQLGVRHARHFDVQIDAIQQGGGDAFLVTRDSGGDTGALVGRVSESTERAGVITKRTHYVTCCVPILMARPNSTLHHCNAQTVAGQSEYHPRYSGYEHAGLLFGSMASGLTPG